MSHKIESGKRYGKLIVTEQNRSVKMKTAKFLEWLCYCDCGNEKWIKGCNLRAGRAVSCGCGRAEHPNWGQKYIQKDSKYFFRNWLNIWRRKSTKRRSMEFNLTLDELDEIYDRQGGLCYYSGQPLIVAITSKFCINESNISIDRIDNDMGYTADNVVLCTKTVNIARNIQTQEEFIQMCRDVANHHPAYTAIP